MTRSHLSRNARDPAAGLVGDYLTRLARALPGSRTTREAALEEVREGLEQSVAARLAMGLTRPRAEEEAIAEFGSPPAVAEAFAPELATRQARRILVGFLITGPLVGVWWALLLVPPTWPPHPWALWSAIPALPLIGVAIAAAVLILATTGSLIRWLPESTAQRALSAAGLVALGCVGGDLTVLSTLALRMLTTSWHPPVTLAALAISGSAVRIPCALAAMRRCRRTSASLRRLAGQGQP